MIKNTRSKRIEARVRPDTLVLVQRAAELNGSSGSDFVVAAAEERARKISPFPLRRPGIDDPIVR